MSDVLHKKLNIDLDKSNMQEAIADFPVQIAQSFEIMNNWSSSLKYVYPT